MKQQTLWENQAIVTDKQKIRGYLAKCKEVLSGAARAHAGKWYWRKTDCEANNINATQA